jgi:hypothetical protein
MINRMEQLIGFVEFERVNQPGRTHIAQWALSEIERLSDLVINEGTRAEAYLARAMKAEAELESLKLVERRKLDAEMRPADGSGCSVCRQEVALSGGPTARPLEWRDLAAGERGQTFFCDGAPGANRR